MRIHTVIVPPFRSRAPSADAEGQIHRADNAGEDQLRGRVGDQRRGRETEMKTDQIDPRRSKSLEAFSGI
jgi:hypothetical protein